MTMKKQEDNFYGTATVGAKGQIVIPAEARAALKIKKGEKMLVFGMGGEMLVITKLSQVEQFAKHLAGKLSRVRQALKKAHS